MCGGQQSRKAPRRSRRANGIVAPPWRASQWLALQASLDTIVVACGFRRLISNCQLRTHVAHEAREHPKGPVLRGAERGNRSNN